MPVNANMEKDAAACVRTAAQTRSLIQLDTQIGAKSSVSLKLELFSTESGAFCLDGSPGGYYWSNGTGANASRWILHFEGGGWCVNETDCLARAGSDLGSSLTWAREIPAYAGMMSGDPAINPDFHDWSKLVVPYCDGASYSGDVSEPYKTSSGELVFFRGRRILDAVLASALKRGLSSATHVILRGSSAGGLGTYIHSDYIKQKLPASVDMVAFADAGLFMDLPKWDGTADGYQKYFPYVARMQNVSALNEGCLDHYSGDERWRCFMAPYTLPYIKTPLFVAQGLYDRWQALGILCADCSLPCSNATKYNNWLNLAVQIKSSLRKAPNGSGTFAHPCLEHETTSENSFWTDLSIDGVTLREAFAHWWRTRSSMELIGDGNPRSTDCGGAWNAPWSLAGPHTIKCYDN